MWSGYDAGETKSVETRDGRELGSLSVLGRAKEQGKEARRRRKAAYVCSLHVEASSQATADQGFVDGFLAGGGSLL